MPNDDVNFKVIEIDKTKMVPMSNQVIEDRLLENYGAYGIKIVMIGVVGAYAMDRKNYDHRCFIKFSVANFARLIGKEEKYAISIFKKTCSALRTKEIPIAGYLDGEPMEFISGILNTFAYSKDEKTLALKFEEHFVPHFMEMSGNFTQHELAYILNLDRLHTISFYRFLKMKIGKDFRHIIAGKVYYCEIQDSVLRTFFECEAKYTQRRDFRNKVLNKIAEEITKGTDLTIAFEQDNNLDVHLISIVKKIAEQEPNIVSMDDFKITKDRSFKKPDQIKKVQKELPKTTILEAETVAVIENENTVGFGSLFSQAHDKKIIMQDEELDKVTMSFLKSNSILSKLLNELFNQNLAENFRTEKELMKYIFNIYQQHHGSIKLLGVLKSPKFFEPYFKEHLANQKAFSLASVKDIMDAIA